MSAGDFYAFRIPSTNDCSAYSEAALLVVGYKRTRRPSDTGGTVGTGDWLRRNTALCIQSIGAILSSPCVCERERKHTLLTTLSGYIVTLKYLRKKKKTKHLLKIGFGSENFYPFP